MNLVRMLWHMIKTDIVDQVDVKAEVQNGTIDINVTVFGDTLINKQIKL